MSSGGGGFSPDSVQSGISGNIGGFMSGLTGAGAVADAQGRAAQAQFGQQQADRSQAMKLMMPTDAEIQQLQQAMAVNQQGIDQSQKLLASVDPAIMSILQGGDSPMLAPIKNQRAQQRAQMEQDLEQQLGPGYKTSSAGIQALNNFDQQTSNVMTQAQQATLGQYGQLQGMFHGQQQQGIGNISALTGQQYGWQGAQMNALMGTPVNPGLQYSGQLANAQANNLWGVAPLVSLGSGGANAYSSWQQGNAYGRANQPTPMMPPGGGGYGGQAMAGGPMDAGGAPSMGALA